ncbi:MAG: MerR family transcriptional regulator [Firmicutes bacterium]|nr:MerR family transcriptional regulator [Bacillota bacterium]
MYKIGEFSMLSKTTVKTLRYYEKEKLLLPAYVDFETGYRYYETSQLPELAKIIAYRQIGLSIHDIRNLLTGTDSQEILNKRKQEVLKLISDSNNQLLQIYDLLEGKEMKYEVIMKQLPEHIVYYMEGTIRDFSELVSFILKSGEECGTLNPTLKCIQPEYCYVEYLDGEYKETDIKVRYSQAVEKMGIENEHIKFQKIEPIEAVCIYHKGSYSNLREAYGFLIKWIEEHGYEIVAPVRESYIDGMWNKDPEEEWLTEIQAPVCKK